MYDMSRGELRYTSEKGYFYENEIEEVSYIKVAIAISIFLLIGLGVYKYDYIKDIFSQQFVVEMKNSTVEKKIVVKEKPKKEQELIKKEEPIIKDNIIIEEKVEPIKKRVEESIESNITVEAELEDEENTVFFTSMGKTVDDSKIQDIYQKPKEDKNSTVIK